MLLLKGNANTEEWIWLKVSIFESVIYVEVQLSDCIYEAFMKMHPNIIKAISWLRSERATNFKLIQGTVHSVHIIKCTTVAGINMSAQDNSTENKYNTRQRNAKHCKWSTAKEDWHFAKNRKCLFHTNYLLLFQICCCRYQGKWRPCALFFLTGRSHRLHYKRRNPNMHKNY